MRGLHLVFKKFPGLIYIKNYFLLLLFNFFNFNYVEDISKIRIIWIWKRKGPRRWKMNQHVPFFDFTLSFRDERFCSFSLTFPFFPAFLRAVLLFIVRTKFALRLHAPLAELSISLSPPPALLNSARCIWRECTCHACTVRERYAPPSVSFLIIKHSWDHAAVSSIPRTLRRLPSSN